MHRPSGDDSSNYNGYDENDDRIKYRTYRARLIYEERIIASLDIENGISFQVYEPRKTQGYSHQDSVRRTSYLSSSSSSSYRILPSRLINIVVITISRWCFLRFFHKPSSSMSSLLFVDSSTVSNTFFASYSWLITPHCPLISVICHHVKLTTRANKYYSAKHPISFRFHSVPINKHCRRENDCRNGDLPWNFATQDTLPMASTKCITP